MTDTSSSSILNSTQFDGSNQTSKRDPPEKFLDFANALLCDFYGKYEAQATEYLQTVSTSKELIDHLNQFVYPKPHASSVTTNSLFGNDLNMDLVVRYKRPSPGAGLKVDICQFVWFKSKFELEKHVMFNHGAGIHDLQGLSGVDGLHDRYPIKFLSPNQHSRFSCIQTPEKITHKGDMIVLFASCPATAMVSTIVLFEKRNPVFMAYLRKDNSQPMFRVITNTDKTCYVILNFGLFYMLKNDALYWMPNDAFKSEILFEAHVRVLSKLIFDCSRQDVEDYMDGLNRFRVELVVKTLYQTIFTKPSKKSMVDVPVFVGHSDPEQIYALQRLWLLPALLNRFNINNEPHYPFLLNELLRSQSYLKAPEMYFKSLASANSPRVTFYEAIMSFVGTLTPHMISRVALERLYDVMFQNLKSHVRDSNIPCLWAYNQKYHVFYRILEVLVLVQHNYQANQSEPDTNWIKLVAPLMELGNRSDVRKKAYSIYTLYHRYHQNLKVMKRLSEKDKCFLSSQMDSDSENMEDNDDDVFVPTHGGIHSQGATLDETLRTYFKHESVGLGEEDENLQAIRTLDLGTFRSFTTEGKRNFEDVIEYITKNEETLVSDQSKEQLVTTHIFNEFMDLITFYKTIGDCSTAPMFLFEPGCQEDRSMVTPAVLFSGSIGLEPYLKSVHEDTNMPMLVKPLQSTPPSTPDPIPLSPSPPYSFMEDIDSSQQEFSSSQDVEQPIFKKPKNLKRRLSESSVDHVTNKRKKRRRSQTSETKEAISTNLLKAKWMGHRQRNTHVGSRIRIKNQLVFSKFVSSVFGEKTTEEMENLTRDMNQFLLTTLYDFVFDDDVSPLTQEDVSVILHGISRVPEKKRKRGLKKKTTVADQSTNEVIDSQHQLLLAKVKSSIKHQLDDEIIDKNLVNQKIIVDKYDGLIAFAEPLKDTDFNRAFESESPFDLEESSVVAQLNQWKEFIKMAMHYTFIRQDIDKVMSIRDADNLTEETVNECIQILDSNNVELVPSVDSQSCFDRSLKFVVNLDSGAFPEKKIGKMVRLHAHQEEDDGTSEDETTEEEEEDDELPSLGDVLIDGKILYDTEILYLHTGGITETAKLFTSSTSSPLSKWVSEFFAVDVYNAWRDKEDERRHAN